MADAHLTAFRIGALSERTAAPGITTSISRPKVFAIEAAEELATESVRTLLRTMMAQVANNGHLPPNAYDEQGKPYNYEWMKDDNSSDHPTIDIRSVLQDDKQSGQFNEWLDDPNIASSDLTQSFDAGIRDGQGTAL
ncbi:hypothetical protein ACSL103130_04715 [Actinomyces slackii]|uniref:Uncharacterized protein n=1 Tax=Actinomyces slackii TaxID=52774 RepID=A0A448KDE6_9ACTO|nr:hypothetical protein [Actinomyces slackii]VEG74922.1 Uncharacterised protein [Actinomyces slackii]